jgi:hypothetical protein
MSRSDQSAVPVFLTELVRQMLTVTQRVANVRPGLFVAQHAARTAAYG